MASLPILAAACCLLGSAVGLPRASAVTIYAQNLAGFNAASGNAPIAINFDTIASGTNLGGQTIAGLKFIQTGSPLLVVSSTQTVGVYAGAPNPATNFLPPTTGQHVLSPGGSNLAPGPDPDIEWDSLTLEFDTPTRAFGFDHLSQSADGYSFTSIAVYDSSNLLLYSNFLPISNLGYGGGSPGGADFWGIVSESANIKRIVITESDGNDQFPDNNIGFDTFRFTAPAPGVPDAWAHGWAIGCAVLGLGWFSRRRSSRQVV